MPNALSTTQDRLSEKDFINRLGIPTAPFRAVDTPDDLARALDAIGLPAVLKTRRFGYDGKGQRIIREPGEGDRNAIFAEFGGAPLILEGFVPFEREVSVVAARARDGSFAAFDLCENEHRDHILALTRVPARDISAETARAAFGMARTIADALDYVGVLAVEMFLVRDEAEHLVVNEIAPRVHNSGHWTIEGALTSQFAQHVRAVCGWPLGDPARVGGLAGRDAEPDRRAGRRLARDSRRARRAPASLRQGRSAAGAQDGACHAPEALIASDPAASAPHPAPRKRVTRRETPTVSPWGHTFATSRRFQDRATGLEGCRSGLLHSRMVLHDRGNGGGTARSGAS